MASLNHVMKSVGMSIVRQRRRLERGATAIEYALMIGLVGIGVITSVTTLKGKIGTTLETAGSAMGCSDGQFMVEYYNTNDLSGQIVKRQCESAPTNRNYDTSPEPGINTENFSIRWTGSVNFTAGSHTFSVTADDGFRVFVDGTAVINNFVPYGPTSMNGTTNLTAGNHTVVIEFREITGWAFIQYSAT